MLADGTRVIQGGGGGIKNSFSMRNPSPPARPAGSRQAEHGSGRPIGNYEMNAGPGLASEAIVARDFRQTAQGNSEQLFPQEIRTLFNQ